MMTFEEFKNAVRLKYLSYRWHVGCLSRKLVIVTGYFNFIILLKIKIHCLVFKELEI
jgi:hypothetical protein